MNLSKLEATSIGAFVFVSKYDPETEKKSKSGFHIDIPVGEMRGTNNLVNTFCDAMSGEELELAEFKKVEFDIETGEFRVDGRVISPNADTAEESEQVRAFHNSIYGYEASVFTELYNLTLLKDIPDEQETGLRLVSIDKSREIEGEWVEEIVMEDKLVPLTEIVPVIDTAGTPLFYPPQQRLNENGELLFHPPRKNQMHENGKLKDGVKLEPDMENPVQRIKRIPKIIRGRKVTEQEKQGLRNVQEEVLSFSELIIKPEPVPEPDNLPPKDNKDPEPSEEDLFKTRILAANPKPLKLSDAVITADGTTCIVFEGKLINLNHPLMTPILISPLTQVIEAIIIEPSEVDLVEKVTQKGRILWESLGPTSMKFTWEIVKYVPDPEPELTLDT